jgi:hypothetical protein
MERRFHRHVEMGPKYPARAPTTFESRRTKIDGGSRLRQYAIQLAGEITMAEQEDPALFTAAASLLVSSPAAPGSVTRRYFFSAGMKSPLASCWMKRMHSPGPLHESL